MQAELIGRSAELRELRSYFNSGRSEFIAVYGRRRVGKTFLIRAAARDDFAFFVTGVYNANKNEQLTNFAIAMTHYSGSGSLEIPENWILAFYKLSKYLESRPEGVKIVFIDELPWMDSAKSGFVSALENGTVLDHIPAENVYKALDILDLKGLESQITIGINLNSKLYGKKGIIKIADKFFEDEELNKLALIAPNATVNIIKGFQVVEKKKLEMPAVVEGIAKCMNPKCITNHQPVKTRFTTVKNGNEILLHCHYCEKNSDIRGLL